MSSSIWNVLSKTKEYGPLVVTQDELDSMGSQGSKWAAEVNAINAAKREDDDWRQELEDLTRRLVGMPTVEEAQARLDNLKKAVASQVKEHKDKIAECNAALKQKFLSPLERTHVAQKAEEVASQLAEFERQSDLQLRFAEGHLADAKTWNPHRERWQELRQRAKAIDKALQV